MEVIAEPQCFIYFFFSSRRRHTRSGSAFLLNRSSDLPVEFIAAVIAYYVHPVNIQTAWLIMEGAEFTENIMNGVERPVKAAELFAFTLRVRAGNTDVLTDAEENVRQKLGAEGVMSCLKVKNVLALALVVRSRCEVLKASVRSEERFSRNA